MHWLEKWRTEHQMSREMLAKQVGVSEELIWRAENERGFRTHPLIANDIADYTGATPEQRDSIVHQKHHGTYKPGAKAKRFDEKLKKAKPAGKTKVGPPKREIVSLNEHGEVKGVHMGLEEAANAYAPCTMTTVRNRCSRLMSPAVNEFLPYGITFRYADEWKSMNETQRMDDVRKAMGNKVARGRQCRKDAI